MFIQAKHYKAVASRRIDLIVIHDMEYPEKGTAAEDIANYFRSGKVVSSAHYCIDNNSIVGCVNEMHVAYHAPGANSNGIGLEHAGYARQSTAEWSDAYGMDMLRISATKTSELIRKYNIPLVWLSPEDVRAGKRGITSHNNVSLAFRKSTHTDPGKNFPVTMYLNLVRAAGTTVGAPPVVGNGLLALGSKGHAVVTWQTKLNKAIDARLVADGDFGPGTYQATKNLQQFFGLIVDGVVGPQTQAVADYVIASKGQPHPVIKRGDKGQNVVNWQTLLRRLNGPEHVVVDGDFGPATETLTRNFQAFFKLTSDGVVGQNTWTKMADVLAAVGK